MIDDISSENELEIQFKLITCIQDTALNILNKIYELTRYTFNHQNQSLYFSFTFNNTEKNSKFGGMLLAIRDLHNKQSSSLHPKHLLKIPQSHLEP